MSRVAVVMSTYNGEKFIKHQIDSIFQQEGVEVELVVRDDGSTDSTCEILSEYKEHYNITVIYGANIGWKRSFIIALENAPECDYYAFADQDDVWYANKLITGVRLLEILDNTKPNLYVSNSWVTDSKLNKLHMFRGADLDISTLTPYEIWVHPDIQGGCGQIFNRVAREYSLRVNDYPFGHDSLIERVCGLLGAITYDNIPHFLYRQHQTNAIGAHNTLISRIRNIYRKTFSAYDPATSISPQCFLDAFGDQLKPEIKCFLELCKEAHRSFKARIKLVLWKDLRKQLFIDDLIFKTRIMIGKY